MAATILPEHAEGYARAGLPVLPLRPGSKLPASLHGKDDASTDLEEVRAWWARCPAANIGVRPPLGVVVLDVDPRHGGASALLALTRQHGGLPSTWTAATGGGGLHIWLRAVGPFRGQLCTGVDIKSHSGYLVMPPSMHPNSQRYAWRNTLPIAATPAWLLPLLRKPVARTVPRAAPCDQSSGARAEDGLVRVVGAAADGGRNHALHWAACRAAERAAPAELVDRLRVAARGVGLPEHEIERTLASALRQVVPA